MSETPLATARNLLVLGCSATKIETDGVMPALSLYDGPMFRVLRSFLRDNRWPESLSVAVLSAKFGLIGGLAQIPYYNKRMTPARAIELNPSVTACLKRFGANHQIVELVMGKQYLGTINSASAFDAGNTPRFATGGIGVKLNRLHCLLREIPHERRRPHRTLERTSRPLYFLPDWDDFLDADYNFEADAFSDPKKSNRSQEHSIALMRPYRLSDGVLVSLAQHLGTKGLLRRIGHADTESLAPKSVRAHFKLQEDQWAFGDCGAFSYLNEPEPTISVEQSVALYNLYEFDYGASVDHIPALAIVVNGKKTPLEESERKRRVHITRRNAERFLRIHHDNGASFQPVGVVQGLDAKDFSRQLGDYVDMGYTHIALGGLVPRSDAEILDIVAAVHARAKRLCVAPWIHLLGIFRPKLQSNFRRLGIRSFDSATYFRKAWLRSGQNYLGPDGSWHAAIRVPPTTDARTMRRLRESGVSERKIKNLEQKALSELNAFDRKATSLKKCLDAVLAYDSLLARDETKETDVYEAYRRTLEARPWESCKCPVCSSIGIHIVIFRGYNRNKRRGAHNTLHLYRQLHGEGVATEQN